MGVIWKWDVPAPRTKSELHPLKLILLFWNTIIILIKSYLLDRLQVTKRLYSPTIKSKIQDNFFNQSHSIRLLSPRCFSSRFHLGWRGSTYRPQLQASYTMSRPSVNSTVRRTPCYRKCQSLVKNVKLALSPTKDTGNIANVLNILGIYLGDL